MPTLSAPNYVKAAVALRHSRYLTVNAVVVSSSSTWDNELFSLSSFDNKTKWGVLRNNYIAYSILSMSVSEIGNKENGESKNDYLSVYSATNLLVAPNTKKIYLLNIHKK